MVTLPPNPVEEGQSGHISHHNEITSAITPSSMQGFVAPSGDTTGATDPLTVQTAINTYGVAILAPGSWYGNTTVIGHEAQWVSCQPGVTWKLKSAGIPAFQWTPANSSSYSQTGTGGIIGRPLIIGPSDTTNPSDGSIAVQMGDIVQLVSDFRHQNCQYGLLLSNQYFWSEQGDHRVISSNGGGTKNPVVTQVAASGGAARTGSFDRTRITVYHDEWLDGTFGLGGVQLLAGAQFDGGSIRQFGNFSGTGQSGVYAMYVSGAAPAGSASAGTPSSLVGVDELVAAVEYDGTGTLPGTIMLDTNTYIERCSGNLRYINFGSASISGSSDFDFTGPISGDTSLQAVNADAIISVSASPSGWSGSLFVWCGYRANLQFVQVLASIPASASVTNGMTLFSGIPVPFKPLANKLISFFVYDNATGAATLLPCLVTTTGTIVALNGTTINIGASGGSLMGGQNYSSGF